jgi:polar amino acid transport system substrate-binding protein
MRAVSRPWTRPRAVAGAVIASVLLVTGCGSTGTDAETASPAPAAVASAGAITQEQVTALIDLTAAAVEKDAPVTLAAINAGEAPYVDPSDPDLYAFVYDTGVTLVATPDDAVRGENMHGRTDAAGKPFRDEIVAVALEDGSGSVSYLYTEPDQAGLFVKSTSFRLATGSDGEQYVVCAGRYVGPASTPDAAAGIASTAEVQEFVEKAVAYAGANGKDAALAAFTAPGGEFHDGELYIYAYDFDGNVIAHGGDASLVGQNLMDMQDPDGLPVIQRLTALAESGSGWLVYQWPNPQDEDVIESKVGYVMKVDDEWFLGSGTYAPLTVAE